MILAKRATEANPSTIRLTIVLACFCVSSGLPLFHSSFLPFISVCLLSFLDLFLVLFD